MYIEKIFLQNFKNHQELDLRFSPKINLIVGANGSGKTNLLDAIHYLSFTKSAFNYQDNQSIRETSDYFSIQASINSMNGEQYQLLCSQPKGQRKIFKVNKQSYERIHEHIGRFPLVLISPFDNDLVREGSESRRKFFDAMIAQVNQEYLSHLINYEYYLKQRNGYLKQQQENQSLDTDLLQIYDQHLIRLARAIYEVRKNFIVEFEPVFKNFYQQLAGISEIPSFHYQSHLHQPDFEKNFKSAITKDLILQRTTMGIHKDDFEWGLNNLALKNFASQGQQKSYVIALKLANYQIIKSKKSFPPFLLLDDIFEKLDETRIKKLLEIVCKGAFGQVFITDARLETSQAFFKGYSSEMCTFDFNIISANG